MTQDVTKMTDEQLVSELSDSIIGEREELVKQLTILQELDRRHCFFQYDSLWAYLVHEKKLDDSTAEQKIRAARAMRRIPELGELFLSGKMNLSLLDIVLNCSNREGLSDEELAHVLSAVAGMSCRKARREIAERYPDSVEIPKDRLRPYHSGYTKLTIYADAELMGVLDEIQGLLAGARSGRPLREVIRVIADDYYDRHHPIPKAKRAKERQEKAAQQEAPCSHKASDEAAQKGSAPQTEAIPLSEENRRIPSQALTHALVLEKGYFCSFVDPHTGQQCRSTYGLQKHHTHSWAKGGQTALNNLTWICKNHHARVSFLEFGDHTKYTDLRRDWPPK